MIYDVIILGSGPAGLTAGIYTVRAALSTLIIAGKTWGGQLMFTTEVENFPGFPEGIQGPDLMMNMRKQAERLEVPFIDKDFVKLEQSGKTFKVSTEDGMFESKSVIVATGADTRWLGVPGEDTYRGRGVSSCAPCDAFFFKNKKVVVVGGGDSAMEEALVISKFASETVMFHRTNHFRASNVMQERVFTNSKIKSVVWNTEVLEMKGDDIRLTHVRLNSKLKTQNSKLSVRENNIEVEKSVEEIGGVVIEQQNDSVIWEYPTDGLFVAIGLIPNTMNYGPVELDSRGYVKRVEIMDETGLIKFWSGTTVPGVFVAGDNHDYRYKQAVTAAGYGCMAALDAETYLQEQG